MRHNWQLKNFGAHLAAGTGEQAFPQHGVAVAGRGDGWVLGQHGGALVLVQAMPISSDQSHVIVVVASPDQAALALCDQVAEHIRRAVKID